MQNLQNLKLDAKVILGNLAGFGVIAVAYLLQRSSCLSLPDWTIPMLQTAQIVLNMLVPAAIRRDS